MVKIVWILLVLLEFVLVKLTIYIVIFAVFSVCFFERFVNNRIIKVWSNESPQGSNEATLK
jgi:hypothetical protein